MKKLFTILLLSALCIAPVQKAHAQMSDYVKPVIISAASFITGALLTYWYQHKKKSLKEVEQTNLKLQPVEGKGQQEAQHLTDGFTPIDFIKVSFADATRTTHIIKLFEQLGFKQGNTYNSHDTELAFYKPSYYDRQQVPEGDYSDLLQ